MCSKIQDVLIRMYKNSDKFELSVHTADEKMAVSIRVLKDIFVTFMCSENIT